MHLNNFKAFKLNSKKFYSSIIKIYSPALNDYIYFNSNGFHHLLYKTSLSKRPRSSKEQYLKLMCLKYVPQVITNTNKVTQERIYKNINKNGVLYTVVIYELILEINKDLKIKVLVKKNGKGKLKFLSTMPIRKNKKAF